MTDITGGKALVVGANGGMGSAIAVALAGAGVDCALMGRNPEAINEVTEDCRATGASAHPLICDIAKIDTIEAAVEAGIERLGGLNYLVNCAGMSAPEKLHETDLSSSEAILDTNLRAFLYLARYALPEINKNPGGAVIKIGAVNHP